MEDSSLSTPSRRSCPLYYILLKLYSTNLFILPAIAETELHRKQALWTIHLSSPTYPSPCKPWAGCLWPAWTTWLSPFLPQSPVQVCPSHTPRWMWSYWCWPQNRVSHTELGIKRSKKKCLKKKKLMRTLRIEQLADQFDCSPSVPQWTGLLYKGNYL